MLRVGSFVQPCNSSSYPLELFSSKLVPISLQAPKRTHKANFSLSLHLNAGSGYLFLQGRAGFAVSTPKCRRENDESFLEMHGADEDDEDDDDDDEAFVPFPNMTRWFENKPPGFGEGKDYDTSVEDKLFEEMQQSRRAQLANINKLKNSPLKDTSKREQMQKATEVSSAIRVHVWNLPKKRNIHKDLQLAFKGFPGILNISPAVSANKKTRDPICKGFAFVDLAYEEDAKRFIETYSRQSITFGKVQKQIKCEITHHQDFLSSICDHSAESTNMSIQERLMKMEENPDINSDLGDYLSITEGLTSVEENQRADFDTGEFPLDGLQAAPPKESVDLSDQSVSVTWEEIEEGMAQFESSEPNENEFKRSRTVYKTDSLSMNKKNNGGKDKKNIIVKGKPGKVPKLTVPGSAKRLKIKEKAVLTGVLAKYGTKTSAAS